jgi:hypothetical protein
VPNPGTGANALENHPLITGLAFAGKPQTGQAAVPTTVSGVFYGNPGTYRLDNTSRSAAACPASAATPKIICPSCPVVPRGQPARLSRLPGRRRLTIRARCGRH